MTSTALTFTRWKSGKPWWRWIQKSQEWLEESDSEEDSSSDEESADGEDEDQEDSAEEGAGESHSQMHLRHAAAEGPCLTVLVLGWV